MKAPDKKEFWFDTEINSDGVEDVIALHFERPDYETDFHVISADYHEYKTARLVEIITLQQKAIEIYAAVENWKKCGMYSAILTDIEFIQTMPNETTQPIGGKLARQALAEVDKMLKELE